jgi:hypothetical protein
MGATARLSIKKTQFTPSFAVPKKHVARRVPYATVQVKAFKENSQLQDWRVKDMVEVYTRLIILLLLTMSFLNYFRGASRCYHKYETLKENSLRRSRHL